MKLAVVFEPDASLGTDPKDKHDTPRKLGEFLDTDDVDVLLIWREYGDQFDGGSRTHTIPTGVWEHITTDQVTDVLDRLGDLQ